MLTLYYKPSCPFCQRVLGEAERLNVKFNLKDISGDSVLTNELLEKGGKQMVPFLVDTERDESMYESNDIIAYLEQHYSSTAEASASSFGGLRIHKGDDTCESCQ